MAMDETAEWCLFLCGQTLPPHPWAPCLHDASLPVSGRIEATHLSRPFQARTETPREPEMFRLQSKVCKACLKRWKVSHFVSRKSDEEDLKVLWNTGTFCNYFDPSSEIRLEEYSDYFFVVVSLYGQLKILFKICKRRLVSGLST